MMTATPVGKFFLLSNPATYLVPEQRDGVDKPRTHVVTAYQREPSESREISCGSLTLQRLIANRLWALRCVVSSLRLSVHLSRDSRSGDGGETCSDYAGVTPDLCAQMALEYLVQNSINLSDTDVKNNGKLWIESSFISKIV